MRTIFVLIIFIMAQTTWAQVVYESVMTSNGFYGQGAFESKSKTFVKDDAKRSETDFEFTGAILKHFTPKTTDVNITRLDKKVIWDIDEEEKSYTEMTFADMKAMMESGEGADSEWPAGSETEQTEDPDSEYEWQEPVLEVKKTGEKEKINGFNTENHLITITTVGKHKKTGVMDTLLFSTDVWASKDESKAVQTLSDFEKKMAKALGFNKTNNMGMTRLFGMYPDQMEDIQTELGKIDGFPIKTDMSVTMTRHATKPDEPEEEVKEEEKSSGGLGGGLGGLFGNKIKKMAEKSLSSTQKMASADKLEIFQATSTVKSLKMKDLAEDIFQVPADYELKN